LTGQGCRSPFSPLNTGEKEDTRGRKTIEEEGEREQKQRIRERKKKQSTREKKEEEENRGTERRREGKPRGGGEKKKKKKRRKSETKKTKEKEKKKQRRSIGEAAPSGPAAVSATASHRKRQQPRLFMPGNLLSFSAPSFIFLSFACRT
jgi:hypothetical protein